MERSIAGASQFLTVHQDHEPRWIYRSADFQSISISRNRRGLRRFGRSAAFTPLRPPTMRGATIIPSAFDVREMKRRKRRAPLETCATSLQFVESPLFLSVLLTGHEPEGPQHSGRLNSRSVEGTPENRDWINNQATKQQRGRDSRAIHRFTRPMKPVVFHSRFQLLLTQLCVLVALLFNCSFWLEIEPSAVGCGTVKRHQCRAPPTHTPSRSTFELASRFGSRKTLSQCKHRARLFRG